jgi:hypothetical protein
MANIYIQPFFSIHCNVALAVNPASPDTITWRTQDGNSIVSSMCRKDTAKNGLELVERVVYVGRDTCERPHGLGLLCCLGFGELPSVTSISAGLLF